MEERRKKVVKEKKKEEHKDDGSRLRTRRHKGKLSGPRHLEIHDPSSLY